MDINNKKLEYELINTLEHIDDLEGIFFDSNDKIDALQLISLYDNYIEMAGLDQPGSLKVLNKRNDFVNYLSKTNGAQLGFADKLRKKWKIPYLE